MRASTIEEIKEGLPFQIEEGWLLRIEQIWLLQAASLWRRNGVVIFQAEAENRLVIRFQPATPASEIFVVVEFFVRPVAGQRSICREFYGSVSKIILRSRELKVGNERPPRNSMFRNDVNLAFGARNPIVTAWGRILSGLDVRGSVPRDQTRCWLPAAPKTRCRRVSRGKNSLCRRLHRPGLRP